MENSTKWGLNKMADVFKCIFFNENIGNLTKIPLKLFPAGLVDDTSTAVDAVVRCSQVTRYQLNQYRPRSMTPYVLTKPLWSTSKWKLVFILNKQFLYIHILVALGKDITFATVESSIRDNDMPTLDQTMACSIQAASYCQKQCSHWVLS